MLNSITSQYLLYNEPRSQECNHPKGGDEVREAPPEPWDYPQF